MAQEIAATIDVNMGIGQGIGQDDSRDILKDIRDSFKELSRVSSRDNFFGGGGGIGGVGMVKGVVTEVLAILGIGAATFGYIFPALDKLSQQTWWQKIINGNLLGIDQSAADGVGVSGMANGGFSSVEDNIGATLSNAFSDVAGSAGLRNSILQDANLSAEEAVDLQEELVRLSETQNKLDEAHAQSVMLGLDNTQELEDAQRAVFNEIYDINSLLENGIGLINDQAAQARSVEQNMNAVAAAVGKANAQLERSFSLLSRVEKKSKGKVRDQLTVKDDNTGNVYTGFVEDLGKSFGGEQFVGVRTVRDANGNLI